MRASIHPSRMSCAGEVTLTGCVLPIGGVKEKVLAARRSGVKVVVFPKGNQRDYDELADDLKQVRYRRHACMHACACDGHLAVLAPSRGTSS